MAAHQQITRDWWDTRRNDFEIFISQAVIQEAGAGDAEAAQRRLAALNGLPLLDVDARVVAFSKELMEQRVVPPGKPEDALHLALATVHGVEYLLTWNCAHIANAETWGPLRRACHRAGFEPPFICTPEELMGE